MTPFVHNMAKVLIRRPELLSGLENTAWRILSSTFFEISSITNAIYEHSQNQPSKDLPFHMDYMFLPAPLIWMEFRQPADLTHSDDTFKEGIRTHIRYTRIGFLMEFHDESYFYSRFDEIICHVEWENGDTSEEHRLPFLHNDPPVEIPLSWLNDDNAYPDDRITPLYPLALLNLVNQPYFSLKTELSPHKGIVRDLSKISERRAKAISNHNVITLRKDVNPENMIDVAREARITGKRIYHFVRGHFKPSIDKRVSSYWRGDKEIGVKPIPDYVVKL